MKSKKFYVLLGAFIASLFIGSVAYLNSSVSAGSNAISLEKNLNITDADSVISVMTSLAEKEVLPLQNTDGWYYTSYSFYNPDDNRSGATYSQSTDAQVLTKQLIPERPLSESYVQFNDLGQITESINIIRDELTGEIAQINVWDGKSLIQEHLKAAGFPEDEYKRPFTPQFQLFTQPRLDSLLQWKDSEGLYVSTSLVGETVRLVFGSNFQEPQAFAGASEKVKELETIETYNVQTGKLISSSTYATTETGQKILLSSTSVHNQELVKEIPDEIQQLLTK